jgi:ribosome-associated translation inhibitor RaiA
MTHAPDIRFIGMEPCGALASVAHDRVEALDRTHRGILSCQIAIALGRKREGRGGDFSVRVDLLTDSGNALTASGVDGESVYTALRDAFDTTDRRLRSATRPLQ